MRLSRNGGRRVVNRLSEWPGHVDSDRLCDKRRRLRQHKRSPMVVHSSALRIATFSSLVSLCFWTAQAHADAGTGGTAGSGGATGSGGTAGVSAGGGGGSGVSNGSGG